jgi:hypothetical protein
MNFKNFEKKEYEVQFVQIPAKEHAEGLCYPPETGIIMVHKNLKTRRQLNVLIEEVFHAHFFDLPEWKARKFSANLGKLIYNKYIKK